jgi:hypothetical protein
MLLDYINLLLTVESTNKVHTGTTTLKVLDMPNIQSLLSTFFNERNQKRKLAKISRYTRAYWPDCQS